MLWIVLWRAELRGIRRDIWSLGELAGFMVCCLLIFRLAGSRLPTQIPEPITLWITLLFGGIIYLGHSLDREWAGDGSRVLEGLRMVPGAVTTLFWVKWMANGLVLVVAGMLGMFLLIVTSESTSTAWISWSVGPLLMGVMGLTGLGTLFAVGVLGEDRRSSLLPILCYPLAIPLILAVSQCVSRGMVLSQIDYVWLRLTAGCALLYVVLAAILFPAMVDE